MTGEPDPLLPITSLSLINVLIADDTPSNRHAFAALLRPLGYALFIADSGKKALELAVKHRFAVILLDVRMPDLSGIETAVLLRRIPFTQSTPIIFVSAYDETQLEVSRSDLDGLVDFLFSPVHPEILTWKVAKWVDLYIRQELLRREAAHLTAEYESLHRLAQKTLISGEELREVDARLATAIRGLVDSLHERLGLAV